MSKENLLKRIFAKHEPDGSLSAKRELTNFCIYITFLIVTTIVAISAREIGMFYFNHTIERLFLDRSHLLVEYEHLVTVDDWWLFTETTFIESVGHLNLAKSANESYAGGNVLLGLPRLRQIRVENETCQFQIIQQHLKKCYGPYKENKEDTSGFMEKRHFSQSELSTYTIRGEVDDYIGAGYIEMLTADHDDNERILKTLQNSSWIDGGSRAVLIEFVLFNSNVNLFCNIKLLAEIPATGGLYTLSLLQSLKYSALWNEKGFFIPICTIIFFALIFYYTFRMIQEILWNGCSAYVNSVYQICNIAVLLFGYFTLIYIVWHSLYLRTIFSGYVENSNKFFSLDVICFWNLVFIDSMGFMVFMAWIGILQYIKFNKTMKQFSITLRRCTKDLLGFSIMFFIVFVAYAYYAVLLFGASLADFDKFSSAVITLIRTLLGDFDYEKLEKANRVFGPIFFLSFILLVFFILMNMFLAIIIDTYSDVKSEITRGEDNRFEVYLRALLQKLKNIIMPSKKNDESLQIPITEEAKDGKNAPVDTRRSMPSRASMPTGESTSQGTVPVYPSSSKNPMFKEEIFNSLFEILSVQKEDAGDSLSTRVAALEMKMEQLIDKLDQMLAQTRSKFPSS